MSARDTTFLGVFTLIMKSKISLKESIDLVPDAHTISNVSTFHHCIGLQSLETKTLHIGVTTL